MDGDTQRFYNFTDDDGVTHVIDTEAKPLYDTCELSNSITKYILFTRRNPNIGKYLDIGDLDSVRKSNFNPDVITVVYVHGWMSYPIEGITIKHLLLEESDVNFIALDWSAVARLDYASSVVGVPIVGAQLAQLLADLVKSTNTSYNSIHIVGASLGAHLAGCAGRNIDGKAARVTVLDPAGPLWYKNPNKIKSTDAVYVEAIHTNAGGFGIKKLVADVDFFPNGGKVQPGCFMPPCSHSRALQLFSASLRYDFIGYKCSNMTLKECSGPTLLMGNNDLKKSGSGIYRLETSGVYPYQIKSD